jgi:heme o synthase
VSRRASRARDSGFDECGDGVRFENIGFAQVKHEIRPGEKPGCATAVPGSTFTPHMERPLARIRERSAAASAVDILKAYIELSKPRIMVLVLLVAAASFLMASRPSPDWARLAVSLLGIAILAAGIFSLNQYQERHTDPLMRRTARRPLPSGRVSPRAALAFGAGMTAAAFALITPVLGWVAAAVALATFVSYVLVYTPMKTRTAWHTTLGAVSGAMPPLLGWAAATGSLPPAAWVLFGILFLWQYPHFLAIDTMHAEEYARAGIRLLPPVDGKRGGATAAVIAFSLVLLLGFSVLPWVMHLAGVIYLASALAAGAGFLAAGCLLMVRRSKNSARILLRASVLYLPAIFAVMAFNTVR